MYGVDDLLRSRVAWSIQCRDLLLDSMDIYWVLQSCSTDVFDKMLEYNLFALDLVL